MAISLRTCIICNKKINNYYGVWENGGTCGRTCEQVKESQPKYEGGNDEVRL